MQLSNNNNEGDPIFSTGLNAFSFSLNQDDLPESIKKVENATSQRREESFLTSDMLGEDVLFSMKQLVKKGRPHLKKRLAFSS